MISSNLFSGLLCLGLQVSGDLCLPDSTCSGFCPELACLCPCDFILLGLNIFDGPCLFICLALF